MYKPNYVPRFKTALNTIITLLDTLRLDDIISSMSCFNSVCITADLSKRFHSKYTIIDAKENLCIIIRYNWLYATCHPRYKDRPIAFSRKSKRVLMRSVKNFIRHAEKDELMVYLPESRLCQNIPSKLSTALSY